MIGQIGLAFKQLERQLHHGDERRNLGQRVSVNDSEHD